MNKKFFVIAAFAVFFVIFNLGYVFHDLLLGPWFHEQEKAIAREHFIIPLVAAAFAIYSLILAYLFPIFRAYYPRVGPIRLGVGFGMLMGVVFDALQGGLIEVATFHMPFIVFVVDSSYHVFVEGSIAGLILGGVFAKWGDEG